MADQPRHELEPEAGSIIIHGVFPGRRHKPGLSPMRLKMHRAVPLLSNPAVPRQPCCRHRASPARPRLAWAASRRLVCSLLTRACRTAPQATNATPPGRITCQSAQPKRMAQTT
jgi:hypothetical protein